MLALAATTFIAAIKVTTLAETFFLCSLAPLLSALLARPLLGERISGASLVAIAIALLNLVAVVIGAVAGRLIPVTAVKIGAGIIFGNSGGVSEAVLRYAVEKVDGKPLANPEFYQVRGEEGLRFADFAVNGTHLKLAVVHGLRNARGLAEKVRRGECELDLIEVMACPGGCVGGAGQPVSRGVETRQLRARGLYQADQRLELHKSQENPFVAECYQKYLGETGGHRAHQLLHTGYQHRRRMAGQELSLGGGEAPDKLKVGVCVGTNCFLKGSQGVLHELLQEVQDQALGDRVEITASFCFEQCEHGPTVQINGQQLRHCTGSQARAAIADSLKPRKS